MKCQLSDVVCNIATNEWLCDVGDFTHQATIELQILN
jgi:hypothetical protein